MCQALDAAAKEEISRCIKGQPTTKLSGALRSKQPLKSGLLVEKVRYIDWMALSSNQADQLLGMFLESLELADFRSRKQRSKKSS